jgi:hypothetical protein
MFGIERQDPQWQEASASLRKGKLYVKLSRAKTLLLVAEMTRQNKDIGEKDVLESPKSFVFADSTDGWNQDVAVLKGMEPSATVQELILAIEAGLRNEAQVDWISRVGGPPREDIDALESLVSEDVIVLE